MTGEARSIGVSNYTVKHLEQMDEYGAVTPAAHVDRAAVKVADAVALRLVQAVHVDDPSAVPDVTVAADAVIEADLGSDDAAFRVEQAEGHELQWYATQEIGPLLDLS